ncbi:MAG: AMP-binding protein [Verrucomicrobiota bacterium]
MTPLLLSTATQLWGDFNEEITLPSLLIRALKRRGSTPVVIDAFLGDRSLNGYQALTMGLLFANWLRKEVPEKRVGIVLPPGFGATIVNLGCIWAGKIPVNLNFTAGRHANESCIQRAEIKTVISVGPVIEKLPDFPWPSHRIDAKEILLGFSKFQKIQSFIKAFFYPTSWLESLLKIPQQSHEEEAAILFTSGSSGDPKGVVLTHKNIIANVLQIQTALGSLPIDSLLGSLPIFHSFGFTATLWWPLLGGPRVVTYPSPMETKALAEVIERHQIKLLLSTPTFLRAFIRRASREQMRSIKMVVTGAEKLPLSTIEGFEAKFGILVCEGYGMTEGSPGVSFNIPNRDFTTGPLRKIGTVGHPFSGIQVEVRDPYSDEILTSGSGMIWLKGPNIFPGYFRDEERTAQVLREGWYKTGDLGYVTEKGFLVIEGRMSRFSKIGGEMVPHGVVEEKIQHALGITDSELLEVVVAGIEDERKGEALLLLTTRDLSMEDLRAQLLDEGLPALWIPKRYLKVPQIPTLASGKLDLKGLQELIQTKRQELN